MGTKPQPIALANEAERLKRAQRAYDAGDFAQTHAITRELASSNDARIATAAEQLRARVDVDPVALGVLGGSLLLFLLTVKAHVF